MLSKKWYTQVGNGTEKAVDVGPLVAEARDKVDYFVQDAIAKGAKLELRYSTGWAWIFLSSHVLSNVSDDAECR